MFVLLDIEWICAPGTPLQLTQLAALRVDEAWQRQDAFYTCVCPPEGVALPADHIALTGTAPQQRACAPLAEDALAGLLTFLQPDDVLLTWYGHDALLGALLQRHLARELPLPACTLRPHVSAFLREQQKEVSADLYSLAVRYGLIGQALQPHCAADDTEIMRRLLQALRFPGERLNSPVQAEVPRPAHPYWLDINGVLHRRGCPHDPSAALPGAGLEQGRALSCTRLCPCCRDEIARARRQKRAESLARSPYQYFFTPNSSVFHTKTCRHLLHAAHIDGCVRYKTALKKGRTPCKHCKPQPPVPAAKPSLPAAQPFAPAPQPFAAPQPPLPPQNANRYFVRCLVCGHESEISDKKRQTLSTKTAFYQRCPNCRRPTRHALVYSRELQAELHRAKQIAQRESVLQDRLARLCADRGFTCWFRFGSVYIRTPLSTWHFDYHAPRVTLYHLNANGMDMSKDIPTLYHTQFRNKKYSFDQTLDYIAEHDSWRALQPPPTPLAPPDYGPRPEWEVLRALLPPEEAGSG